jgi:hypothetical protein
MYKTISNKIIRQFKPCYDPLKIITDETEELTVKQWVEKYRNIVPAKDILWLLLREEFISGKDLRLFAVWCAREALKLIEKPDKRSVEACNVAERYSNGEATKEELLAASDAALNAAQDVDCYVYHDAFYAAFDAAYAAVHASNAALAVDYVAVHTALAADHASDAAHDAAFNAAHYASALADAHASSSAYIAARDIVSSADAARDATSASQLDKLLTYFE